MHSYGDTRTRTMQVLSYEFEYYVLNNRPFIGLIEFLELCFFDDEHREYGEIHALPVSSRLYPFPELKSQITGMTYGNEKLPELIQKKPFQK